MKFLSKNVLYISILIGCSLFAFSCVGGSSAKSASTKELSYQGISFNYPEKWNSKTEETAKNGYYIECENNRNNVDMLLVIFLTIEYDPKELMNDYIKKLKNSVMTVTVEEIVDSKFGEYDCVITKYKASYLGSHFYGLVSAIKANDKAIIVVRQSDTEKRAVSRFTEIENSFKVQ